MTLYKSSLGKEITPPTLISPAMGWKLPIVFFYEDGFGIT